MLLIEMNVIEQIINIPSNLSNLWMECLYARFKPNKWIKVYLTLTIFQLSYEFSFKQCESTEICEMIKRSLHLIFIKKVHPNKTIPKKNPMNSTDFPLFASYRIQLPKQMVNLKVRDVHFV